MSKEQTTVVVNVPENLDLSHEEADSLKKRFRADLLEVLKARGEGHWVIHEEITQVILPPKLPD